jgi:glycerate kinase
VTYRDIRAVLEQRAALLEAAQTVLAGLNERIDTAPLSAVPVFAGIADLHSAILQATGGEDAPAI